jgi:cell division protein ZapA
MSTKQLEVQIMGQSYLLGCPVGGEERLLAAVDKVDQAMCKVRDAGKIKARDRIAVLAAEQTEVSPSTSTQVATTETSATLSDSDQDRLGQLLKKLDQALHQDGQLI